MNELTKQDFQSATWARLKVYLEARLAGHRLNLEANSPETVTAANRGRVDECKILLALDQAPAQEAADD